MEIPNDSLLNFWRSFGNCGFALVIIGVLVEVAAAGFLQRWEENKEKYQDSLKKYGLWLKIIERTAGAVLIIGLILEYRGHKEETRILDSANAILYDDGKHLSLRIEKLRKANDDFEAKMADREIVQNQIDKFKASLTLLQAPKKPVWVVTSNPSRETLHFISQIREMLNVAGYGVTEEKPDFMANPVGTAHSGVFSSWGYTLDLKSDKDANTFVGFSELDVPNNRPLYGMQLLWAFKAADLRVAPIPVGKNGLKSGYVIIIVVGKEGF